MTTGTVEITVNLEAICWDTFAAGSTDSSDRPLAEALVALSPATGAMLTQVTGADGKVRFENVPVGAATVRCARTNYVNVDDAVTVAAGAPATKTLTMRSTEAVCSRKHTPVPPPEVSVPNWLGPLFWDGQPWILVLRDVLWLVLLVAAAVLIPIGLAVPPAYVCLCIGAFCFAIFSYVNHIVFGMILGVIGMALAFAGFLAIVVFEILAMAAVALPFPIPPPDIYMFPPLCAIWFAFAASLIAGRREFFNYYEWGTVLVCAAIGAVVAMVVYLVMDFATHGGHFSDWAWMVFVQMVCGFIAGFIGGFLGHVFVNDGSLADGTTFGIEDLELPYAGERYCVQGHHGYISHWVHGRADQEYSYDWSMPEGTHILAAREGHIVKFKESRTGNITAGNEHENFIYVQHRDGSVAEYLHLRQGGVTEINGFLAGLGTTSGAGLDIEHDLSADPVHMHAGQRLCACGNVGISMFDHLHFDVRRPVPVGGHRYMPVKFKDADVASHEGRCFSMRKYRSSNVDRGACSLT
ncbi:MAG: carboxypeptidase regulatory-like domain-containing protein [Deltaproteobacteria bacterium]|nr:carboxypeptidase regulatory-like domain-containing protein [Nannocystaceae bacterium]